METDAFN